MSPSNHRHSIYLLHLFFVCCNHASPLFLYVHQKYTACMIYKTPHLSYNK